jgi:formate dehydrogenase major subunit
MFAEIDPVLARERGIEDGRWMTIVTERAEIEARAQVTDRMRPLRVDGKSVHQVGLPWHWGYSEPYAGDSTNDLGAISGDPNVSIQESKAFTCDVRAGRRGRPSTERLKGVASPSGAVAPDHDDPLAENPQEAAQETPHEAGS